MSLDFYFLINYKIGKKMYVYRQLMIDNRYRYIYTHIYAKYINMNYYNK